MLTASNMNAALASFIIFLVIKAILGMALMWVLVHYISEHGLPDWPSGQGVLLYDDSPTAREIEKEYKRRGW